ncbi:peptidoglycan recognition protein family protein [Paenibacillus campinasensis]|uniref:N-acetylmuramoyl-L-alanine amidase n=1 Tax=Paenibacillus campinasensis TaxID=66347 RepID=A0A268F2U3_9BACL|nr:N-acetylmuramoyl-L-alanine amidase [Paenibacillus campinasensis]MUG64963.1 N-acetylmuramoyl-L-alanine amidase [Paenibacillus campinasensis]PAD79681.1 N-acetylmuramoyl-L-alanine amidase [Paenibacillus campinasensis]
MELEGFIIHHTVCGKDDGSWDFLIRADGTVTPSPAPSRAGYICIALEGDFDRDYNLMTSAQKEQLFTASKIIMELSRLYQMSPLYLIPHSSSCPGAQFPWNSLVIYPADGYH